MRILFFFFCCLIFFSSCTKQVDIPQGIWVKASSKENITEKYVIRSSFIVRKYQQFSLSKEDEYIDKEVYEVLEAKSDSFNRRRGTVFLHCKTYNTYHTLEYLTVDDRSVRYTLIPGPKNGYESIDELKGNYKSHLFQSVVTSKLDNAYIYREKNYFYKLSELPNVPKLTRNSMIKWFKNFIIEARKARYFRDSHEKLNLDRLNEESMQQAFLKRGYNPYTSIHDFLEIRHRFSEDVLVRRKETEFFNSHFMDDEDHHLRRNY